MLNEPIITINGTTLTVGQAMTVRVAIEANLNQIRQYGLGDDEVGKDIADLYIKRSQEIIGLMYI